MTAPSDQPTGDTALPDAGQQRQILRFSSLRPGALFADRYRIRATLGSGGFGEVYRALDRQTGDDVALKVLFPGPTQTLEPERLERELRLLDRLQHPGIVRVLDHGESDGLRFVAFELLQGQNLADWLREFGRLGIDQCLALLEPLLEALATAHRAGVIHRDIKPANVFLCDVPPGLTPWRVVLLDFGLARQARGSRLTSTGRFLGTPEYVSPEQAAGVAELDSRSDLYSVGVLAARALGSPAPNLTPSHSSGRPMVPRVVNRPRGPSWLQDLIGWCLEPDPAHRPCDADALLERLRQRRGRPPSQRVGAMARRLRRRLASPALGFAAAGGALLVAGLLLYPARIDHQHDRITAESLAGVSLRETTLPHPVRARVPWDRGLTRRRDLSMLLTEGGDYAAFDPDFPVGLVLFDAWSGAATPFSPQRNHERSDGASLLKPLFPHHDGNYNGIGLERLTLPDGQVLFVATYAQKGGDPALVLGFDERGKLRFRFHHDGRVSPEALVGQGPDGRPRIIFSAKSAAFGQRSVVFGITPPRPEGLRINGVALPPFDFGTRSPVPAFWTVLPDVTRTLKAMTLRAEGEHATLLRLSGEPSQSKVRIVDGLPDRTARGGLEPDAWQEAEQALVQLLRHAGALNDEFGAREAAARLEGYAGSAKVSPTQAAVARTRAIQLLRDAGDLEKGLRLAKALAAAAPESATDYALLIDLAARRNAWHAIEEHPLRQVEDKLTFEPLLLAALLGNRLAEADRLRSPGYRGRSPIFCRALRALHRGHAEAALEIIDRDAAPASYPDFAFLKGLTLLMLDTPELEAARAKFAEAAPTLGGGHQYPTALADAYAAALSGETPATSETVEDWLARQRQAGRSRLRDLYFVAWAEALASGIAAARGDDAAQRRHAAAARETPGFNPMLERFLERKSREGGRPTRP